MEQRSPGPLVSVEWLAAHLDDPDLRLVHVSPDRSVYDERHLPGAVYSDLHKELAKEGVAPETGSAQRLYMVPPRDEFEATLSRWGARSGDRIVFYDDVGQNRQAIRGYWLCRLFGLPRESLHVLDGGLPVWEAASLPVTATVPSPPPGDLVLAEPDATLNPTVAEIAAWSREAAAPGGPTRILDVRSLDEYLGRDVRARRGGRIPGARQREWVDLVAPDGRLRPVGDALATIRASGVAPEEVRAVYCQGGFRASLVWFVLHELAGFDEVHNYAGSWEEWGNRPDVPIEAG